MKTRTTRMLAGVALAMGLTLGAVPAANAAFHLIKIKEITGESGGSNKSFIELQMYEPGQNLVSGHNITIWDQDALVLGSPTPVGTLPLVGSNPPNSQSQRTVLIGDMAVAGRDFTLDLTPFFDTSTGGNVAGAGAACFEAIPIDCVSWGAFTGAANLPDGTTPFGSVLGVGVVAFRRNIGGGTCSTALDAADDTNNASADFSGVAAAPTPNSAIPTGTLCASTEPKPTSKPKAKKCKRTKKGKKGSASAAKKKKCKKKK